MCLTIDCYLHSDDVSGILLISLMDPYYFLSLRKTENHWNSVNIHLADDSLWHLASIHSQCSYHIPLYSKHRLIIIILLLILLLSL